MQMPVIISIVALCISLASFCISFANFRRDRDNVLATCRFSSGYEEDDWHLQASVVNAGRRPVVLRMWGGTDKDGAWAATMLKSAEGGHRLGEHERLDFTITAQDVMHLMPDGDDIVYADLWFEDTLGRRHPMKGAKAALQKLFRPAPRGATPPG
jgi:hypothetical protein